MQAPAGAHLLQGGWVTVHLQIVLQGQQGTGWVGAACWLVPQSGALPRSLTGLVLLFKELRVPMELHGTQSTLRQLGFD